MEKLAQIRPPLGSRHLDLKKSFKLAVRSILVSCSKEEFCQVFSRFTSAEQEHLHRLFLQVITSLHGNIEDEFESLCLETEVGTTLDLVEQLVDEQALDPLFSNKSNIMDTAQDLSTAKNNEIQYLTRMLEKADKENCLIRARVELLKEGIEEVSSMSDDAKKFKRHNTVAFS